MSLPILRIWTNRANEIVHTQPPSSVFQEKSK